MPFDEDQTVPPDWEGEPEETKALGDEKEAAQAPDIPRTSRGETVKGSTGAGSSASSSAHTRGSSIDRRQRDADPGHVFGDRFEVVRLLGKGGMGQVFLVLDRQIEKRKVALKLIRSRFSNNAKYGEMFFREVRTAQGFVSEHVVQVRDCGRLNDGQLFLTMDYVEGESLVTLMRRERTLAARHALEIVRQVLLGVGSGHEKGFIHRDIKPQNIMLSGQKPKTETNPYGVDASILDFGIGGLLEEVENEPGAGSAPYFSPEQSRGERLDSRSDLFAVGILLYEMIVGERPFKGRTAAEIGTSIQDTNLVPLIEKLAGVPKPIKRILRKALQKEREKRYQSAADFVKAIEGSEAFQGGEKGAGWVGFAAVFFAASTVGLGVLAQKQFTELAIKDQAERGGEILSDLSDSNAELIGGLRDKINSLRAENGVEKSKVRDHKKTIDDLRDEVRDAKEEATLKTTKLNSTTNDYQAETWQLKFLKGELQHTIGRLFRRDKEYGQLIETKLKSSQEFFQLLDEIEDGTVFDAGGSLGSMDMRIWMHSRAYLDKLVELAQAVSPRRSKMLSAGKLARMRPILNFLKGDGFSRFQSEAAGNQASGWLGTVAPSDTTIAEEIQIRVLEIVESSERRAEQERLDGLGENESADGTSDSGDSRLTAEEAAKDYQPLINEDIRSLGIAWDAERASRAIERLGAILALLEERLDSLSLVHEQNSAEERSRLMASVGRAPGLLLDYIEKQGDGAFAGLTELVEEVVGTSEEQILREDGSANIAMIRSLPGSLLGLTEKLHLDTGEGSLATTLDAPQLLHRLAWLTVAQDWYEPSGSRLRLDGLRWWKDAMRNNAGAASGQEWDRSWKAILLFQIEASRPSDFFPARMNGLAVYRLSTAKGGGPLLTTNWEAERCRTEDQATGRSQVIQRELGATGEFSERNSASRTPEFLRSTSGVRRTTGSRQHDLVFFHDLGRGELGVKYWQPDPETAEKFEGVRTNPRGLPGISGQLLSALVPPDSPEGYRCLVNEGANGRLFWIHPVLGVVREETRNAAGQIIKVRELAHLER